MNKSVIQSAAKAGYFNVTLISCEGSPCNFQAWSKNGSPKEAVERILSHVERGERKNQCWDRKQIRAFVFSCANQSLQEFDLLDKKVVADLREQLLALNS